MKYALESQFNQDKDLIKLRDDIKRSIHKNVISMPRGQFQHLTAWEVKLKLDSPKNSIISTKMSKF
jgi:hypothetical protein